MGGLGGSGRAPEAVDGLIGTVQELDAAGTNRGLLDRANELLSRCMARLVDEFRALIEHPDDAAPQLPGGFGSDDSEDYDADDEPIPIAKPATDFDGHGSTARGRFPLCCRRLVAR
jgi:hypothetical protein